MLEKAKYQIWVADHEEKKMMTHSMSNQIAGATAQALYVATQVPIPCSRLPGD